MLRTNNAKRSLQSTRFPTFHVTSIFFKDFLHIKITRIVIITLFVLNAVTCFLSHVNLQKTIFRSQKHFPGSSILHMKIYQPSIFNSPTNRPKHGLGRRSTMPSILITPPKKSNSKLFVALQDGKIYWSFIQHLLGETGCSTGNKITSCF